MDATILDKLNDQQRAAVTHPNEPLLIVAGAGTGKTNTVAHRVAWLISTGIHPGRVLLLTFSRRAAAQMIRRVHGILSAQPPAADPATRIWGGTFHATANRLLRLHAQSLGLAPNFTVVDRSDAEDLLHALRSELGFDKGNVRFPRKTTCLAIYSRCINAQEPPDAAVRHSFPWCLDHVAQLTELFKAYTLRKQEQNILDYDDLLLYWFHLMHEPALAAEVRSRFDAVLVDEYQDTNALQARILQELCPGGRGLTVVGDDAQSIYSFRAATVHNILDFAQVFPTAAVRKLEQNYRSVQPILDATNAVIAQCPERHRKELFSTRRSAQKPRLVTLTDETQQSDYLIGRILEHVEEGIPLHRQAVLFRAAHHSDALEVELGRRNIPFVKYGGLKFLEAAHVKDVLSLLRLAENPRDAGSALRVLQLLDGFGPAHSKRAVAHLAQARYELKSWLHLAAPPAAVEQWPALVQLLMRLAPGDMPLAEQVAQTCRFYTPILEKRYDSAHMRARDLEQMQHISANFQSRAALLADLTLDPPASTQDLAGPPLREEDYLILSTIHSAKGCEWDAVYVIHAADGNIPSDMACGSQEEIEEERRLFYVALTRARDFLEVCFPLRYYVKKWASGDAHTYAQLTRFLSDEVLVHFERVMLRATVSADAPTAIVPAEDVRKKIAAMWG